ncbi:hypothetical protein Tco_0892105 [Tanacetum coccineum]|uniref:Uncharacterized protein n=1 Tax=Tanacetum coccineum TaxID=301880 RepID=A0ABQ5C858_9ASTR
MAQPQRQVDVHQDELRPPSKRYALRDASKKIDLENPKELTMTLDDFRIIFYLPQATDNNHDHFVPALKFTKMVLFYLNNLGFKLISYNCVFGVNVPTTQSQPIESTQGTHRTTSSPRTTNPDVAGGESSALQKFTAIRLRIPPRRSTRLTPTTPIPTIDEAEDIILQDTIQLSLTEQKSREELKAKQNKEKVKEHLMAEEIEKLVEGTENVEEHEVDSSILRKNDKQNDPGTRLEPKSNKESLEVENTVAIQHVNINEEEEETEENDYELKIKEKGKDVEETRSTPSPTTIRSPRIHSTLISPDTKKL